MDTQKRTPSPFALVVARGETAGHRFLLNFGTNLIGRWDPDSGAFPEIDLEAHDPEAKVSRLHAQLEVTSEGVSVEDIGSMNGTFVNRGSRLQKGSKVDLKAGDELVIGKTFLELNKV